MHAGKVVILEGYEKSKKKIKGANAHFFTSTLIVIFEFLIANGANVVVTGKRYMVLVLAIYNQKYMSSHDNITLMDSAGAAILYIKHALVGSGIKRVAVVAFRNELGTVSTASSSMHSRIQWE